MENFHLSQHLPLLVAAISALYAASVLADCIYKAFFHPLSKYPGPMLCAGTAIPLSYHRLKGDPHLWLRSLHQKYGPVVRFEPRTLSYIDPAAWKDIFGHKVHGRGDLPKDVTIQATAVGGKHSIIQMNDADHSRTRRLLAHAMSDKALREQQEIITQYVHMLVEKMKDVASMPGQGKIDMVRWLNFTTFDIIADLSFGQALGMLKQGEWVPWIFAINKLIPIAVMTGTFVRFIPPVGILIKLFLPASYNAPMKTHIEYSKARVDERISREVDRPDFWKYILRNQGKENGTLSTDESHALGMTLMLAGSETTATLLSGLFNMLLNNRDKLDNLVSEIRGAYSSSEEIDMDNLARLPYLHACLEEALRLYPPTPTGQQRMVPQGGRQICGDFVPEGTFVTITHWSAYRDSSNWHRPDEFLPERWLPENHTSGPFANDRREVMQPFSFGPRNCIGKNLAYHEMRLITSAILWNFDLELCNESRDWANHKVYGLAQKPPLMVKPHLAVHEKVTL